MVLLKQVSSLCYTQSGLAVTSLNFRTGDSLDAIIFNIVSSTGDYSQSYGGSGGMQQSPVILGDSEYLTQFAWTGYSENARYLGCSGSFTTSLGREIKFGGNNCGSFLKYMTWYSQTNYAIVGLIVADHAITGIVQSPFAGCLPCGPGSYIQGTATQCALCSAGTYGTGTGITSQLFCFFCSAGAYSTGGASVCTVCAAGTFSNLGNNVYNPTRRIRPRSAASVVVLICERTLDGWSMG